MSRKDEYAGDLDRDEVYRTILDGLARYSGDPLLADISETVKRYASPYLAHALNKNQMASKRWLADELAAAAGANFSNAGSGDIWVLGGWYGVLGAVLLNDPRFAGARVRSIDIDPDCVEVAEFLNRRHVATGRFQAVTADMMALDYATGAGLGGGGTEGGETGGAPGLVVNTSCEHLDPFEDWYGRIPAGTLVALQSNDMFEEPVHSNCVADLAAFGAQAPLAEPLYAGEMKLKRYTRFMLIGRK